MPRKKKASKKIAGIADDQRTPLKDCVDKELKKYFKLLDGQKPCDLHKMVIGEAEHALLAFVLKQTDGNQTRTADFLGMSRGTLRKKLKEYELE
ncbi:MAG: helix-turn-helix domain-containing protein [Pseudomonadota bacterium]